MRCPECETPLAPSVECCHGCGLSLGCLDGRYGTPPAVDAPVTDLAQVLSGRQFARLERQIRLFERGFREVHLNVLTQRLSAETRLAAYAFWLFNQSRLSQGAGEGGDNRHLLFLIDSENRRANLTAGYGLEPFISGDFLHEILKGGEAALASQHFYAFLSERIAVLEAALHATGAEIPEVYGIHPALVPGL